MASRFGQKRVAKCQEYSVTDSYLFGEPSNNPLNELSHSASWWADREQENSLREQLKEMGEHVARLQDMLKYERTKFTRLQLRCNHQEAELKRREHLCTRVKERLSQLTDRHRDKAPAIDVLNFLPGGRGKKENQVRSLRSAAKHEEASLRLMVERREAELREELRLRHSLTTLLQSLRVDMDKTLKNMAHVQSEVQNETLDQAEGLLDDQVTGGVIQSWRRLQKRLSEENTVVGTDHDKVLIQLEAELKESHQLVRLQQQLLQDGVSSPLPSELADSYFLEEWERLQMQLIELDYQRRTFEKERNCFTDAAIRLSHERRDLEQQKALLVKQQYLCDSPVFGKGLLSSNRRESTALNFSGLGPTNISGCVPITPSSTESGARVRIQTPTTPELYSALNLSYHCRAREVDHQLKVWDGAAERIRHTPHAPHLDWSFE